MLGDTESHVPQQPAPKPEPTVGGGCPPAAPAVSAPPRVRRCRGRPANPLEAPLPGVIVLRDWPRYLTKHEKSEVFSVQQVWCFGRDAQKTVPLEYTPNSGFDHSDGRYRCVPRDHIAYRYELVRFCGRGAYGECWSAIDHALGADVVLKILKAGKQYHRAARYESNRHEEMKREHDPDAGCFVRMHASFEFRNHAVLVFEPLSTTLYTELHRVGFGGLQAPVVRGVASDVLRCLTALGQQRLVHCDLKPENVMLKPRFGGAGGRCKVIDFGSSVRLGPRPCERRLAEDARCYMQSRYYRAPEIVLGGTYGAEIDMWSLGCLLAELDIGKPLFNARLSEDLPLFHAEMLGIPPRKLIRRQGWSRAQSYWCPVGDEQAGRQRMVPTSTVDSRDVKHPIGSRPIHTAIRSLDSRFADFLRRCLAWDPAERLTPDEALAHPWIIDSRAAAQTRRPQLLQASFVATASEVGGDGPNNADDPAFSTAAPAPPPPPPSPSATPPVHAAAACDAGWFSRGLRRSQEFLSALRRSGRRQRTRAAIASASSPAILTAGNRGHGSA